jgi:hypothetical protein
MSELTEEQKFVIFCLYNRVAERFPPNPYKGCDNNIVVNGVDVTKVVKELLQDIISS